LGRGFAAPCSYLIARITDVHPAHLVRVFRKKFGCTIGEYVRRLRVEFACRQIRATDAPLSEIAAHAGFFDQSHLNKIFKNLFKLTPYEYRKIHRTR
jgi:AraC family transcriptional regulator